jgi:hypothetical protein
MTGRKRLSQSSNNMAGRITLDAGAVDQTKKESLPAIHGFCHRRNMFTP